MSGVCTGCSTGIIQQSMPHVGEAVEARVDDEQVHVERGRRVQAVVVVVRVAGCSGAS